MATVQIRIEEEGYHAAKEMSAYTDIPMSVIVNKAMLYYYDQWLALQVSPVDPPKKKADDERD